MELFALPAPEDYPTTGEIIVNLYEGNSVIFLNLIRGVEDLIKF